ncbi:type 1 fimbrial protein [Rahnella woolbedingensis]|uniref:Type 1 fimbrial protein n=2 Tax=Rahnella woolbedingensis TaxID=1510574 RepID=A0A419NE23_9GAMM|nr:type 1 fimbrial protein [Rahnella woolbedingensis]
MNRVKWMLFLGVMASGMIPCSYAASSGTIHFYGAIIEGGCSFSNGGNKVTSTCERGTTQLTQVHTLDPRNSSAFSLPLSLGQVTTEHINNNPHLAIMTVSYN